MAVYKLSLYSFIFFEVITASLATTIICFEKSVNDRRSSQRASNNVTVIRAQPEEIQGPRVVHSRKPFLWGSTHETWECCERDFTDGYFGRNLLGRRQRLMGR